MKNFHFILIYLLLSIPASAQKVYFMYLQSENQVPFYVKMGDKIRSSSGSGYLILSSLVDSAYNFAVGFPAVTGELRFTVALGGKDRGFLIRQSDNGWNLVDLQTSQQIKPQNNEANNISYQARNDAFTSLLSKVADDPGLLLIPVVAKEDVTIKEKKKAEKPAESNFPAKDSTAVVQNQTLADVRKPDGDSSDSNPGDKKTVPSDSAAIVSKTVEIQNPPVDTTAAAEVYKRSLVKKHSESSTSEGFGLVFYDKQDQETDTIRLMIPNPKFVFKSLDTTQAENNQMLEIKKDVDQSKVSGTAPSAPSTCKTVASENEFFKLRKNMAAKISDEGMVEEARKYFRNRCFTTEQIRNLSGLFLTSAGKYQFFDAAWMHVTDRDQFAILQSEIKDDYYVKRFKTLVGQ
ncbi:MAG: hypothetical protein ACJ75B_03050 [Flavisolibacter sp.]